MGIGCVGQIAPQQRKRDAPVYLASRYARDAAQLSLTAQVAQTYFQLRAYDAALTVSNSTVKGREQSLNLQRRRFEEGYLSKFEVAQAEAELASAQLSAQQQALAIQNTETALGIARTFAAIAVAK